MQKITKAVFPVAGLGTRFLPATKASPKEMLPIVDKPLIQYAVEEAVAAGITDLIFITGRGKRAIEDHFDKAYELEAELQAHGKNKLLKEVRGLLPEGVQCAYVRTHLDLGEQPRCVLVSAPAGDVAFAPLSLPAGAASGNCVAPAFGLAAYGSAPGAGVAGAPAAGRAGGGCGFCAFTVKTPAASVAQTIADNCVRLMTRSCRAL